MKADWVSTQLANLELDISAVEAPDCDSLLREGIGRLIAQNLFKAAQMK